MRKIKTYSEFLNESKVEGSHFLKTYKEVEDWVQQYIYNANVRNIECTINHDTLEIDVENNGRYLTLYDGLVNGKLPVKFGKMTWSFELKNTAARELVSLEGFPHTIKGFLGLKYCKNLKSLEYCPKEIKYGMNIGTSGVETLEGTFGCKIESIDIDGCYDLRTLIYGEKVYISQYSKFKKKSRLYGAYGDGSVINNEGHLKSLYNWVASKGVEFETVKGFCDRLYKNDKGLYLELTRLSKTYAKTLKQKRLFDRAEEELVDAYKTSVDVEGDFY